MKYAVDRRYIFLFTIDLMIFRSLSCPSHNACRPSIFATAAILAESMAKMRERTKETQWGYRNRRANGYALADSWIVRFVHKFEPGPKYAIPLPHNLL